MAISEGWLTWAIYDRLILKTSQSTWWRNILISSLVIFRTTKKKSMLWRQWAANYYGTGLPAISLGMWFLGVNPNQVDPFLSNIPIFILTCEMFLTGETLLQYKTPSMPSKQDNSYSSMTTNQEKAKQTSSSPHNSSPPNPSNACEKTPAASSS